MRTLVAFSCGAALALAGAALADQKNAPPPAPPPKEQSLGQVAPAAGARMNLEEVQGLMAVQRLDGWLLYDAGGSNPVAQEVVAPRGATTRRWFYLVPAKGDPVALVHRADAAAFAGVPGQRVEYASWRELETGLKALLKGRRRVAMEYSPQGALPAFSRVDAGTMEWVKALGAEVVSSAELVQAAKTRWGKAGRTSHYVAAHHLAALKDDAFAFIAGELRAGRAVSEWDVAERLQRGYATRGLAAAERPIVAAGPNTADPAYTPRKSGSRVIVAGDLVLVTLVARQADDPLAVYAEITWMAYAGDEVPARYADPFAAVVKARDETVAFVSDRVKARKAVRGFEADKVARGSLDKAGLGDRFVHRTGRSLDASPRGDGANLDDYETHDVRTLVMGTGFTVAPGVYQPGEWGVRSGVSCYLGDKGLEVTTAVQREIVPLLAK